MIATVVDFLKGILRMNDKSNKKFWNKIAKLYAPLMEVVPVGVTIAKKERNIIR